MAAAEAVVAVVAPAQPGKAVEAVATTAAQPGEAEAVAAVDAAAQHSLADGDAAPMTDNAADADATGPEAVAAAGPAPATAATEAPPGRTQPAIPNHLLAEVLQLGCEVGGSGSGAGLYGVLGCAVCAAVGVAGTSQQLLY